MTDRILGVVLAGGAARRMGGGPGAPLDKGLLDLGGHSLLAAVLARLAPQCDAVVLSANGDPARFAGLALPGLALPVLADTFPDSAGPLAGILAALDHAAAQGFAHVLSAAADTPFLPPDLAARLAQGLGQGGATIAMAATRDAGGLIRQPVFALWPVSLRDALRAALTGGEGKVSRFAQAHGVTLVEFPLDAFFNVNTPEDLVEARLRHRAAALPVYGITGRKNAGKTTLTEALLAEFTARGLRVSTVKHAHHDTDIDQPGRDSHRHRQAGAMEVALVSPRRWAVMHELRGNAEPPLAAILGRLSPCDLVLVEGYKHGPHPKIEVWRRATGQPPLAPDMPGITALASDQGDGGTGLPVLAPDDVAGIADFITAACGLPAAGSGRDG